MPHITTRPIRSARPKSAPFFIRDTKLQGFAVKVNPSGSKKYIVEVWKQGKSKRKTLGSFPDMKVSDARDEAINFINSMRSGRSILVPIKKERVSENTTTLETLFNSYINGGRLKNSTIKNYRHVVFYYLKDWIKKLVSGISKEMVEKRYYRVDEFVFDWMCHGLPPWFNE